MPKRSDLLSKILAALRDDVRVRGCLQHGTRGDGSSCHWPELEFVLYVDSKALEAFKRDWQRLSAQFGELLWAQFSGAEHYCACFDLGSTPLLAEFEFIPTTSLDEIPLLPSVHSAEMLYDGTGGRLSQSLAKQRQQAAPQTDIRAIFDRVAVEFWIALFVARRCMADGQFWEARQTFHVRALPKLMGLLRLESGDMLQRPDDVPTFALETAMSKDRLAQLDRCIPEADESGLEKAVLAAVELGTSVCSELALTLDQDWPEALAGHAMAMTLPSATDSILRLRPIGVVENQIDELLPPDAIKAVASRIRVYPEYSEGLDGLSGGQRLLVIFQFHRLSNYELRQHPRNDKSRPRRGVFALHSPRRPNPIGVTEVDLVQRDGNILVVSGLDAVNGTPVLDLKLNS